MTTQVQFIELDIPWCSLQFGVAPCTATGTTKCFNCLSTCLDTPNYTPETVTLRFTFANDFNAAPDDIYALPCLDRIEYSSGKISFGEDLGERSVITVYLKDMKHSDTGPGFDKYWAERDYDPYNQGTLFGKLRERQPYLSGQAEMRWYIGYDGQAIADMEVRHFVVDQLSGPMPRDGIFSITAKDILTLLDDEHAQAPVPCTAFLASEITDTATTMTALPEGVGDLEFEVSGYANIGGNEIVAYSRDTPPGNDANTLLLLHMEGTDEGGTTSAEYIDSSAYARAATRSGSPTFEADFKKFGTTSMVSATDDGITFPDSADWDMTSDKTIDSWHYIATLANGDRLWSHASSSTVGYRLLVDADGSAHFALSNTSTLVQLDAPAGTVTAGAWHHFAVERYGNIWTLFIDGVIIDQDTVNPNASYPAVAATFKVGLGSGGSNGFIGYTDEFRVSNVARYQGAAFTPKTIPYQSSSDIFLITRAQLNSEASTHSEQDRIQRVLAYVSQAPETIINDLEVNYAGVLSGYIPYTEWQADVGAIGAQTYTAYIVEPTSVRQLVTELLQQVGLAHWWSPTERQLKLRPIAPVSPQTTFSEDIYEEKSLEIYDQIDKRIDTVQVYYGLIDPTKGIDDLNNFAANQIDTNDDARANYYTQAIRVIKSRWIPRFGGAVALELISRLLSRFSAPPRRFNFNVLRDEAPILGEGHQLSSWALQEATGEAALVPIQISRVQPGAIAQIEAEEMIFDTALSSDPNHHIILINFNTEDFNMREAHDSIYGEPTDGITITAIVASGVIVSSTNTAVPAFDTGAWTGFAVTLELELNGSLRGKGGRGGRGAVRKLNSSGVEVSPSRVTEDGFDGGDALLVQYALTLSGTGTIKSGGGGGGGGGTVGLFDATKYGGAGGGGAGDDVGEGAVSANPGHLDDGDDGTTTAGGAGKTGSSGYGARGGAGGGPGLDGVNGNAGGSGNTAWSRGGTKGNAGKAIVGNSFVTETGTVTVTGPRV